MKSSSVKLTCLLLALLASGSSLLSCGESGDTVGEQNTADPAVTETAAETEAPAALTLLPEADYGAHDYRILLLEEDDRYVDIMTEGMENGDIMNDLVFRRNRAVEEKYNITNFPVAGAASADPPLSAARALARGWASCAGTEERDRARDPPL